MSFSDSLRGNGGGMGRPRTASLKGGSAVQPDPRRVHRHFAGIDSGANGARGRRAQSGRRLFSRFDDQIAVIGTALQSSQGRGGAIVATDGLDLAKAGAFQELFQFGEIINELMPPKVQ